MGFKCNMKIVTIISLIASASALDCSVDKCLKKCCPLGQSLSTTNHTLGCQRDDSPFILNSVDVTGFSLLFGNTCKGPTDSRIKLDQDKSAYKYEINQDGILSWMDMKFNYQTFCVDLLQTHETPIVCVQPDDSDGTEPINYIEEDKNSDESQPDLRAVLYCTGMIISMPFLLLTFIVYALLPDRNLHMKALMSYVLSLFLGYLCLVIINLSNDSFEKPFCKTLGYSALFFFMVSFLWMNVICVDIWLAFSGLRGYNGSRKHSERKRFLLYCAYAWGMAVLHELVVFLIDENTAEEKQLWYDPGIGGAQCFIYMGYPELLYFYGPMAILIIINAVLFSITAIKIRRVKKDTSMLKKDDSKRHSYESDKQKFNLYVKLLFAMGVNWSLEIISWAVMWQITDASVYIWYLPDFCNAIYGVFIFFIFVFKRSTWKMLKKRYYSFIGKPYLAHSMTNNQRITSYSTTNTSLPADSRNSGVNTESAVLTTEA